MIFPMLRDKYFQHIRLSISYTRSYITSAV